MSGDRKIYICPCVRSGNPKDCENPPSPYQKLSELEDKVTPEQRGAMLKAGRAVKMDDMTRIQEGMDKHDVEDQFELLDKDENLWIYEVVWSHGGTFSKIYRHSCDAHAVCSWYNNTKRNWYQKLTGMKFLVKTRKFK